MTSTRASKPRIALYAGSFDPVTLGHEDLIRRVLSFADKVVVAVANNVSKQPLFSVEERAQLDEQYESWKRSSASDAAISAAKAKTGLKGAVNAIVH